MTFHVKASQLIIRVHSCRLVLAKCELSSCKTEWLHCVNSSLICQSTGGHCCTAKPHHCYSCYCWIGDTLALLWAGACVYVCIFPNVSWVGVLVHLCAHALRHVSHSKRVAAHGHYQICLMHVLVSLSLVICFPFFLYFFVLVCQWVLAEFQNQHWQQQDLQFPVPSHTVPPNSP